jgi:hypothetical protein
MKTSLEIITPEMAKEYLAHNTANRALRSKVLAYMVRDMKSGKWRLTHQGIAFDANGNLVDGQHRLSAIVLAGVPIQMMVTRGLDDEAILNIDTGSQRTPADAFKIRDLLAGEDDPAMRHKGTIAVVRKLFYCGYNNNTKLTVNEIDKMMTALEPQLRTIYKICLTRGKASHSCVNAAVLAALLCGESADDLNKFVSVFLLGNTKDCTELNIGAAFRLANLIMDAKVKHISLSDSNLYGLAQNAIWNFLHGNDTKLLRKPKQLRYPVDIIIKTIMGGNNNA